MAKYRGMRRFDRTGEPEGGTAAPGDDPSFVVQIHDATRMHFDFRLEVDGVLKSWAVPKGPSTDPRDKRLAVPTEDHPLEYREYEGVIPGGQYGAGPVIVWDHGTYHPLTDGGPEAFARALERGHASFELRGTKLLGAYALTRIHQAADGGQGDAADPAWLLVKKKDAHSTPGRGTTPDPRRARSVLTGRTLAAVEREEPPEGPARSRNAGSGPDGTGPAGTGPAGSGPA
ncbi:DNA polymerase ligase N-terminal domain-containing protein [Streptomyces sp. NPDC093221]|uniref:DNA polymerase ligase N-terminal domain-containing protein n=1 Tax=Streptomyces sp. NPDC093221 TaxID=3366032 RepID=UPI00382FBE7B